MQISTKEQWYAVYTKARHEKKVAQLLAEKAVEYYLPLIKIMKQWSDRKKIVEETLFKSYIFVKASNKNYIDILQTYGIVKFISFEGKAASIPDYQIEAIRKSITDDVDYSVSTDRFKKGLMVEIETGSMKGVRGEIISISGKKKLLLRIDNVGYSLVVELPVAYVAIKK
jgi:transcription antitermination factor NusG